MNRALLSPASALVAHLEPLIVDRRVLVIGNAERSAAEHVLQRGARLVQFLDPDPKRVTHAAAHNSERRLSYAQLTNGTLRDGSFECAIVEDVNLIENLTNLVAGIKRCLGPRGVAVIAASNAASSTGLLGASRGGVDYDALCEAAEEHFESVIMYGQSPFLGYSVVQFDLHHPPDPALDNSYLGEEGETPDFYVALCGSEEALSDLGLEEMSIIQLPAARFVENSEQIHRERELRAARRVTALEVELRAYRSRGSDKEVARLTAELEERDTWIQTLKSRAEAADARADDTDNELEELEQELETTHQLLKQSKTSHQKELDQLKADLETARQHLKQSHTANQKELDQLKAEIEKTRFSSDEARHQTAGREALEEELTKLDEQNQALQTSLKEKARSFEKLERRLAEAEKELDDLHDQLDETEDQLIQARSAAAQPEEPEESRMPEVERDVYALEDQLKERGERVLELEAQLKKLETYAKTLTAELTARESNGGTSQSQLETLSRALAEREADLVAAHWTIGQLKQATVKG